MDSDLYKELGALTKSKERWEENIPYVASLLTSESTKIRAKALWLLGEMGLAFPLSIKDSVPAIASLLSSTEPIQAQICPLQEAVDFTATDHRGNEIHLFDILDSGQAVFIHFFINYNADPQLIPFITEAFHIMGCNTQDVFFMEISHRLNNRDCQQWADEHHVAYPTIGIEGGSCDIYDDYGITASPTFILIMPDRSITIHGVMELYPFSANDVVNALAQYGNLQPDYCLGTVAVETDTVFIYEYSPGRLELTNLTASEVTVNSFSTDPNLNIRCMCENEDVTHGGMAVESGRNAVVEVYLNDAAKDVQVGKMYISTSAGDLETVICYPTLLSMDEISSYSWSLFPNPADDFITIKGETLQGYGFQCFGSENRRVC